MNATTIRILMRIMKDDPDFKNSLMFGFAGKIGRNNISEDLMRIYFLFYIIKYYSLGHNKKYYEDSFRNLRDLGERKHLVTIIEIYKKAKKELDIKAKNLEVETKTYINNIIEGIRLLYSDFSDNLSANAWVDQNNFSVYSGTTDYLFSPFIQLFLELGDDETTATSKKETLVKIFSSAKPFMPRIRRNKVIEELLSFIGIEYADYHALDYLANSDSIEKEQLLDFSFEDYTSCITAIAKNAVLLYSNLNIIKEIKGLYNSKLKETFNLLLIQKNINFGTFFADGDFKLINYTKRIYYDSLIDYPEPAFPDELIDYDIIIAIYGNALDNFAKIPEEKKFFKSKAMYSPVNEQLLFRWFCVHSNLKIGL